MGQFRPQIDRQIQPCKTVWLCSLKYHSICPIPGGPELDLIPGVPSLSFIAKVVQLTVAQRAFFPCDYSVNGDPLVRKPEVLMPEFSCVIL